MELRETGSEALVAAPDAAQVGVGDALSEPSQEANPELSPFAAEVQAWRAAATGPSDTWQVARRKCGVWAVLIPALLMVTDAAVLYLYAPAVDPEPWSLVVLAFTAFWLGLSLLIAREFVLLAIFGGGLSATPDGLLFRFGRRSMILPWSDIESVGVERRSNTKGGSYTVLAIRFIEGDYRWPRAFSLWSSRPDRLCISPYILTDPAQLVADGLAASLDQHSDPASRASRPVQLVADGLAAALDQHADPASRASGKGSERGPRRHLVARTSEQAVSLVADLLASWLETRTTPDR